MAERVVTVRFYVGMKRKVRGPAWPTPTLPVNLIAERVDALTIGPDGTAFWNHRGRLVLGRVRKRTKEYVHIVFYRLRADELPDTLNFSDGQVHELDLEENEALAEPTEMLFFTNGVIGHLANHFGPGSGLCAAYTEEKTGIDMVMGALIRDDVLAQLREDDQVQAVTIRVASANVEQLGRAARSLVAAGQSAANAAGTGSVEMIYRARKGQKDRFWQTWWPRVRRIAALEPGTVEKLKAVRRDDTLHRDEEVDLLTARITRSTPIAITTGRRNIDPAIAEAAIVDAYNAEEPAILRALEMATDVGEGTEDEEDG